MIINNLLLTRGKILLGFRISLISVTFFPTHMKNSFHDINFDLDLDVGCIERATKLESGAEQSMSGYTKLENIEKE